MSTFDEALDAINRGREGLNEGLSLGLPRLSYYIPGIQPGAINLIGGMTGSGKSALAMSSFVHNPYEDWKNNKKDKVRLKIFVYSLEISREILMVKFICRNIFRDHGIYTDIKYVLSRGKHRVSDEIYKLVVSYAKYYEEFEEVVEIHGPENPTGIRNTVHKYLMENGKDTYKDPIQVKDENNEERTLRLYDKFVPLHPNMYVIVVVDHLNILKGERGFTKKQNIDKLTEYMVEMSNRYKISPVLVQQINRGVEQVERKKTQDIMLSDFKESGDTTDAAHNVFALNHPYKLDELKKDYKGYFSNILKNNARFLTILKCRDGETDLHIGLQFVGGIGAFKELPKAEDMKEPDYQAILNLKKHYE
jgi:hypothetical protein